MNQLAGKPLRAIAIGCFALAIVLYVLESRLAWGLAGLALMLEIVGWFVPDDAG